MNGPENIINEKMEHAFRERLTHLHLSQENFGDLEAFKLAGAIKTLEHIHHIDLSHNNITNAGVKEIGSSLKSNTSLFTFDISNNKFTYNGFLEILKGIKINQSVRALNLSRNIFQAEDNILKKEIIIAFHFNKSLTSLNLSNCNITDVVFRNICEGLGLNTTLEYLNMGDNLIEGCIEHRDFILKGNLNSF